MNTEVMESPHLSLSRLALMGLSSLILCMSFIMSLFSPFPLALAVIMYGRKKGYLVAAIGLALSFFIASLVYGDLGLFGVYFCVIVFSVGIAEIVKRGIPPIKGLVSLGLGFILLFSGAFTLVMNSLKTTPKEFIIQQIQKSADRIAEQKKALEMSSHKDAYEALHLLDRPELLAQEVTETFPSYLFMGVFLMLWFNMFLVLKSRRLLYSGDDYPFSEKTLLSFKVPFSLIFVLVGSLVLAVWGEDLGSPALESGGLTVVKCLGIFYFFQGFGVLSELLNFLGLRGFFRTLIVMITVFFASYLIAIAGLFDNWFDFRKYFIKLEK